VTLWYLTRATGVVALVLLTITLALGVANVKRFHTSRIPRFVVNGVHRNASLLAVTFLFLHVLTAITDGYVPLHVADVFVPFISAYRPFWVGLGALAVDLLTAVMVTSLLRKHLSRRLWRATHWLAYVSWPVALAHSIGTGTDAGSTWMWLLIGACILVVAAAVASRLAPSPSPPSDGQRQAGRLAGDVLPVGRGVRSHPVVPRAEVQPSLESAV